MTNEILILLIAFQVKHLIADYYLQYPYMYENKGKEKGWLMPLFDHSGIHASGTFLIVLWFLGSKLGFNIPTFILAITFSMFDLITHFVIDRWKATRKGGPDTKSFWTNLGLDQMFHHLIGIIIIWMIT